MTCDTKTAAMNNSGLKKPNATNKDRMALVVFLSQRHKNGRLNKGAIAAAEEHFPVKSTQIKAIWRLARANAVDPNVRVDFKTKMKGNLGRKPKYNQGYVLKAIQETPLSQRRTLRALSSATSIPPTTLRMLHSRPKMTLTH